MTPIKSSTKTGEVLVIREAVKADAPLVIECAKQVAGETDFLLFTPEEFLYTIEEEEKLFEKMSLTGKTNREPILGNDCFLFRA